MRATLRLVLGAAGAALLLSACAREVAPLPDEATIARARAAADSLGPDLQAMLLAELDRGGPEAAVAVCSDSAQVRTARHSRDGLTIRRVGTRVRNPRNAPDSLERVLLARLAAEHAAGRALSEVGLVARGADGAWEYRMLRPIVLLERCTACHGTDEQIPPAARALIASRYPADSATGYAPGDLRGGISVRIALPSSR